MREKYREALSCLNMTESDPGFEKDHAEPRVVFPVCREMLGKPLMLTDMAQSALAASQATNDAGAWAQALAWTASGTGAEEIPPAEFGWMQGGACPGNMAAALRRFYAGASRAFALFERAMGGLSRDDRESLAAWYLSGVLYVEEDFNAWADLAAAGVSSQQMHRAVLAGRELDGRPASKEFLDRLERINLRELLEAGRILSGAAEGLAEECRSITAWPGKPVSILTPLGFIRIGSRQNDCYRERSLLILDPAGDDAYEGDAGAANGLMSGAVAAIVDIGGDDRYRSPRLCGAGAALFGLSAVLDRAGDDEYECRYAGQGCGLFGVGWLKDASGDDQYRAGLLAQAAGVAGAGFLMDAGGSDTYQAGIYAQGFGGIAGIGWLCDRAGNDRYFVGGREPDYERHKHRFVSFGQGTALGMRPGGGGGIGILADLEGNDVYIADVYGQGVGYWYSAGMLLDAAGHDSYQVYEYGQGTGIHLSSGLLYDGRGNDLYAGFSLSQGSAHDFAVGILVDAEGDDTYTADHFSQGRAINNAFALLADASGKDAYFGRRNEECQGMGHYSAERGYDSLSLLLDMEGADQYSGGASNDAVTVRPDDGLVYDVSVTGRLDTAQNAGVRPDDTNRAIVWTGGVVDVKKAAFDDLLFHASRYGCTEERRRNKELAWQEMRARGTESLRHLMSNAAMENMWIAIYARQMLDEMPAADAADVLLEFIRAESKEVRKLAVFFLGFCDTPRLAGQVRPLLGDPDVCGAAVRTLGKWRDEVSVPKIAAFLSDPKERRRAQAATALGEIGSDAASAGLIKALGDPVFTVRDAARKAIGRLPASGAGARLREALAASEGAQRRQIVRCLGDAGYKPAFEDLEGLLGAADEALAGDVKAALRAIDPGKAARAIGRAPRATSGR